MHARHWAWGCGNNDAQDFIMKGQICGGKKDEGNMQISQKSRVEGKPIDPDSEKIRTYSRTSYIIFGEGLGIAHPPRTPQYGTDNTFVINTIKKD